MPIKSHEIPSFSRAMQTYGAVCKLLGAFLEPSALWAQLKAALDAECAMDPGGALGGGPWGVPGGCPEKPRDFSWETWRRLGDFCGNCLENRGEDYDDYDVDSFYRRDAD